MMIEDWERFHAARRNLGNVIWRERWTLGIYLGLVWLAAVGVAAWTTWM